MRLFYENIHVRLGGKEILKGVDLCTEEGKVTGIIGPNGCGKSTLIKTTFGLVKPVQGRILVGEREAYAIRPREMASIIGYVGQDTGCVFDFSVWDVISMAMYARSFERYTAFGAKKCRPRSLQYSEKEIVRQALEELGIYHLKDRSILSLSGGERKLVFIARAIAQGADTLILDEPTNHLDISRQLFLMDYLRTCGRTVLIVLHDLRLAAHYCHRVYLMREGEVLASGDPIKVLDSERTRQVFGICAKACVNQGGQRDFSLFDGISQQENGG